MCARCVYLGNLSWKSDLAGKYRLKNPPLLQSVVLSEEDKREFISLTKKLKVQKLQFTVFDGDTISSTQSD